MTAEAPEQATEAAETRPTPPPLPPVPAYNPRQALLWWMAAFQRDEERRAEQRRRAHRQAWRAVRLHGWLRGAVQRDELLEEVDPKHLLTPQGSYSRASGLTQLRKHTLRDVFAAIEKNPNSPVLPNDADKEQLEAWRIVTRACLEHLEADADETLENWPDVIELLLQEERVLMHAREEISGPKSSRSLEVLQEEGYTLHESGMIVRLAHTYNHQLVGEIDVAELRSMDLLRWEQALERARACADVRAEMAALKHLSVIRGYARMEVADDQHDFVKVIEAISTARAPKRPAATFIDTTAKEVKRLPG
jgi:hypothetical protein